VKNNETHTRRGEQNNDGRLQPGGPRPGARRLDRSRVFGDEMVSMTGAAAPDVVALTRGDCCPRPAFPVPAAANRAGLRDVGFADRRGLMRVRASSCVGAQKCRLHRYVVSRCAGFHPYLAGAQCRGRFPSGPANQGRLTAKQRVHQAGPATTWWAI